MVIKSIIKAVWPQNWRREAEISFLAKIVDKNRPWLPLQQAGPILLMLSTY
jgi:hypothetical protein